MVLRVLENNSMSYIIVNEDVIKKNNEMNK